MKCPECFADTSLVIETYHHSSGDTIRRRLCMNCQKRYTTREITLQVYNTMHAKAHLVDLMAKKKKEQSHGSE